MAIKFESISPDHVRPVKPEIRPLTVRDEPDSDWQKAMKKAAKIEKVARQVAAGEDAEASGNKVRVTMYLSEEVIAFFKALGPGYQTKIDDTLKRIVREGADRWLVAE